MRIILLADITIPLQVCEMYELHRETYYLAIDYIDRYLLATKNVPLSHLQLIG